MHNCRTPAQKSSKLCTHKRQSKKHDKDLQFAAKWYYLKLMPNSAVLLNFSPAGTVAKWACMSGTEPGVTSTSPYLLDLFVLGFVLNMQVRSRNHIQGCKTLRSLLNIMSKLQSFRNTKFSQILHRIMCVTSEAEYQAACLQLCLKAKLLHGYTVGLHYVRLRFEFLLMSWHITWQTYTEYIFLWFSLDITVGTCGELYAFG